MRMYKKLIFILSLTLLLWTVDSKATSNCGAYLEPFPQNLVSMLGRNNTYTVEIVATNFIRRFLNGDRLKSGELEYVIRYILNKPLIELHEAVIGIDLLGEYGADLENPLVSRTEFFFSSVIKLKLIIFGFKQKNSQRALEEAGLFADEYLLIFPQSEIAKELRHQINQQFN